MDKNNSEFGDDQFKEYMDKINSQQEDNPLGLILDSLKHKTESIFKFYSKTLETYLNLESSDPLKEKLNTFIYQLIEHSIQTLDQLSYILIDYEDDNDDIDKNDNLNGEKRNDGK